MSQLKKLTRLGGDTRKIAALLQAKAPKGEMLAYINPQEAALLRAAGGSGKPHADTGIPSFQVDEFYDYGQELSLPPQVQPDFVGPEQFETQLLPGLSAYETTGLPQQPVVSEFIPTAFDVQQAAGRSFVPAARVSAAPSFGGIGAPVEVTGTPPPINRAAEYKQVFGEPEDVANRRTQQALRQAGVGGRAGGLSRGELATLLGLGGVQALLGSRAARGVAAQGRAGAEQERAIAAPYQQKGQQLQAQAARGELTPQAQQSLQAVQAQLAQGVQARGGVGVNQAAAQIEAVRQQLLQTQADYGLKLSGIGDEIARGALRSGLQADKYANDLTSSYMNNIMQTLAMTLGR
jgi:hypothetical protein